VKLPAPVAAGWTGAGGGLTGESGTGGVFGWLRGCFLIGEGLGLTSGEENWLAGGVVAGCWGLAGGCFLIAAGVGFFKGKGGLV